MLTKNEFNSEQEIIKNSFKEKPGKFRLVLLNRDSKNGKKKLDLALSVDTIGKSSKLPKIM